MNVRMFLAYMEIVQIILEALIVHASLGIQVSNQQMILVVSPVKHFSNKLVSIIIQSTLFFVMTLKIKQ